MTGLALTRAPPAPRPLRFLLSAPLWGVFAGLLLAASPEALAGGRWAPPAVALVHVFTLGVLGNAMLGSLLQFLPVAASTPVPGVRLQPLALEQMRTNAANAAGRAPSPLQVRAEREAAAQAEADLKRFTESGREAGLLPHEMPR